MEGWRSHARAFLQEGRTRLHHRDVVRARPPTGKKLFGSKGRDRCPGGYLASKTVSSKSRAEVWAVYIFPLILYRLFLLPLPKNHLKALHRPLSKLLWRGWRPIVRREVYCQRPRNWGSRYAWSGEPLVHWKTDLFGSITVEGLCVEAKSDPKSEGRRKLRGEAQFVCEYRKALRKFPGSSGLSRSQKELYRDLVVGSVSDPLVDRLGWLIVCSHKNWAPDSGFSLTWRLAQNAVPLFGLNYKVGQADMPDCFCCDSGLEETAKHAFYDCKRVRPF